MTDTGRPDRNGLMGNCDCMTLWTIRAAQAAGLEHETLCAIMSEAQGMAEAGTDPEAIADAMRHWSDTYFHVAVRRIGLIPGWIILARAFPRPGDPPHYLVPVAYSPTGWER